MYMVREFCWQTSIDHSSDLMSGSIAAGSTWSYVNEQLPDTALKFNYCSVAWPMVTALLSLVP